MICNIFILLFTIGNVSSLSATRGHNRIENNHTHQEYQHRELSDIVRCGAEDASSEMIEESARIVSSWRNNAGDGWKRVVISVNTYFHIIKKRSGEGTLTQAVLTNQLNVMNRAFPNFNFIQAGLTTTINDDWFSSSYGSSADRNMKQNLRQGGPQDLNVYFKSPYNSFSGTLLGYATFPWDYDASPSLDGVVVHYATVPGGSFAAYNEGDTLVHEVGHWLGLFHTFQDGSCSSDGDAVEDTPYQSTPTYGCPSSKDSCPNSAGTDSIRNYMDYSDDPCLTSFTAGQNTRMAAMWANYRSSNEGDLGSGPPEQTCFSSATVAVVKGKGNTPMDNIRVGDEVLTGMGNYEKIYSIDHHHPTKPAKFIQIYYSLPTREKEDSNKEQEPLELTSKHMIFLAENLHPVPANTIKIGDQVQTLSGPGTVTKILYVSRKGLYNPLTEKGSIVVNGIVSSTYSAHLSNNEWISIAGYKLLSHQDFFSTVLRPYMYICTTISLDLCKTKDEKVLISALVSKIYMFILKQDRLLQVISIFSVVSFAQISRFVLNSNNCGFLVLLLISLRIMIYQNRRKSNSK